MLMKNSTNSNLDPAPRWEDGPPPCRRPRKPTTARLVTPVLIGGALWPGGKLYDIYGTYTAVWWIGVGIGAFSALVHLPIREGRLEISGAAA